jgi:hypothetical protein
MFVKELENGKGSHKVEAQQKIIIAKGGFEIGYGKIRVGGI